MKRLAALACIAGILGSGFPGPLTAAGTRLLPTPCAQAVRDPLPERANAARSGSDFAREIMALRGNARDALIAKQVLSGNIPAFLRQLDPVTLSLTPSKGERIDVTICVTPDYMAVGSDNDYVRVPMGLPTAARIASKLGFMLPTATMVDAIYDQAEVRLSPSPMPPNNQMESTDYFLRHTRTVDKQRHKVSKVQAALTAGQKKDLVLSNRLRSKPGRVAIYGWHRQSGKPIQPLSTVHGAGYADYSHGVRLVSTTAFVNGVPRDLADILQDPRLARIVNSEGPIPQLKQLLASLQ
jgi:hypothetical protein